jgi:hypothetical protein
MVAAALRLYDAKSFWYDEFFGISMARASWPVFWHIVKVKEANMVLYLPSPVLLD